MIYIIKESSIIIITSNYREEFNKKTFNRDLLNNKILNDLSFEDLKVIWKDLYGIPDNVKEILKKKTELYRNSTNVKAFKYREVDYWLDKDNRNSLLNLSSSSLGNIELILGNESLSISPKTFKSFLIKLEDYAHKCFVVASKHLNNINNLTTIEDILNYDYTTGYPEKIVLE